VVRRLPQDYGCNCRNRHSHTKRRIDSGTGKDFWSADRKFKSLLAGLNTLRTAEADELTKLIIKMRELSALVAKVLDLAGKRGYTNRTLVNSSIQSLRTRNAELQDLIEGFELSLDPNVAISVAEAVSEFERGETVSLESLFR
jgi:hypothetical protein